MKKCGIISLTLLALTICSCNGGKADKATNVNSAGTATETITQQQNVVINDTVKLDSYTDNSPVMRIDVTLEPVVLANPAATGKAVREVSYIITGSEYDDLTTAGAQYIAKLKEQYLALRPEYIDIRANNDNPHWFNREYSVNSSCSNGYKEVVNYILDFFEYEGGAHPYSYKTVINFDRNDGHEVTLDEIMKEGYEEPLLGMMTESIMAFLNVGNITELDQVIFDHNELYIPKNVVIGSDKLTFIYNKYEIAPYAVGEIIAEIPYEKLKDILK